MSAVAEQPKLQVSVEKTEGLGRKMTVEIPASEVDVETQERMQKMLPTLKLPGFRPGKIPMRVVQQRFGASVRNEVLADIMQRTLFQAIQQEDLQPAGMPSVQPTVTEAGKNFVYEAHFEVLPEIKVKDLAGKTIEQIEAEIKDADIDDVLEQLRHQNAEWEDVKRAAKTGDQVNIDFEGSIDDESFDGGSSQGFDLELGSNSMIPGFEDGIVGAKAGDELTIDVDFPEEYHHKEMAGKKSQFKIKVNQVQEAKLPEINEEFAKKFNVEEGGVKALREDLKKNMGREFQQRLKILLKEQVLEKLIEVNSIELPSSMIKDEISRMREEMQQRFQMYGQDKDLPDFPDDMFSEQAERRVTLGLLMTEYIKAHEIKADEDKVKAFIEEMASSYEKPEEIVNFYYSDKQKLGEIEAAVLEEEVVDKLLETAKLKAKKQSYKEVMHPEPEPEKSDKKDKK